MFCVCGICGGLFRPRIISCREIAAELETGVNCNPLYQLSDWKQQLERVAAGCVCSPEAPEEAEQEAPVEVNEVRRCSKERILKIIIKSIGDIAEYMFTSLGEVYLEQDMEMAEQVCVVLDLKPKAYG